MQLETVLVVDDEPKVIMAMRQMLEPANLIGATNPFDAVNLARQMKPQLALIDHYMPLRNGLDVVAELRREFPTLVIAYMSGYLTTEISMDAIRAGATLCVDKDYGREKLLEQIKKGGAPFQICDPRSSEGDYNLERNYNRHIWSVLALANGNRTKAAEMLGIRRTTLQSILSRIGESEASNLGGAAQQV